MFTVVLCNIYDFFDIFIILLEISSYKMVECSLENWYAEVKIFWFKDVWVFYQGQNWIWCWWESYLDNYRPRVSSCVLGCCWLPRVEESEFVHNVYYMNIYVNMYEKISYGLVFYGFSSSFTVIVHYNKLYVIKSLFKVFS